MVQVFLGRILLGLTKKFYNIVTLMKIDIKLTVFALVQAKGMSYSQIRAFGRRNSNAFIKYIRMPTLRTE